MAGMLLERAGARSELALCFRHVELHRYPQAGASRAVGKGRAFHLLLDFFALSSATN